MISQFFNGLIVNVAYSNQEQLCNCVALLRDFSFKFDGLLRDLVAYKHRHRGAKELQSL